GLSMIFISHDLAVVRFMSDRVAVMKDGCVVEIGETETVYAEPQHAYTRQLVRLGMSKNEFN
ncbi:MAG: nickel import ATP-binding protein NikD, partial [bacterium]